MTIPRSTNLVTCCGKRATTRLHVLAKGQFTIFTIQAFSGCALFGSLVWFVSTEAQVLLSSAVQRQNSTGRSVGASPGRSIPPSPPDALNPVAIIVYRTFSLRPITSSVVSAHPRGADSRKRSNCCIADHHFAVRGPDVALLHNCGVNMPQDPLNGLVGNSKLVKVCR